MQLPYVERRRLLESLELAGPHWQTSPAFEDGEALLAVVSKRASKSGRKALPMLHPAREDSPVAAAR
jgi:hypothetical protein